MLFPADPAVDEPGRQVLRGMFDKLFAQFAKEGRVANWAVDTDAGGSVLVIAHDVPGGDRAQVGGDELSGCSKDKVAKALAHAESQGGPSFLGAPPIVVDIAGRARCCDRATLRKLISSGEIGVDNAVWNLRAQNLGEWRIRNRIPIRESWLYQLL